MRMQSLNAHHLIVTTSQTHQRSQASVVYITFIPREPHVVD